MKKIFGWMGIDPEEQTKKEAEKQNGETGKPSSSARPQSHPAKAAPVTTTSPNTAKWMQAPPPFSLKTSHSKSSSANSSTRSPKKKKSKKTKEEVLTSNVILSPTVRQVNEYGKSQKPTAALTKAPPSSPVEAQPGTKLDVNVLQQRLNALLDSKDKNDWAEAEALLMQIPSMSSTNPPGDKEHTRDSKSLTLREAPRAPPSTPVLDIDNVADAKDLDMIRLNQLLESKDPNDQAEAHTLLLKLTGCGNNKPPGQPISKAIRDSEIIAFIDRIVQNAREQVPSLQQCTEIETIDILIQELEARRQSLPDWRSVSTKEGASCDEGSRGGGGPGTIEEHAVNVNRVLIPERIATPIGTENYTRRLCYLISTSNVLANSDSLLLPLISTAADSQSKALRALSDMCYKLTIGTNLTWNDFRELNNHFAMEVCGFSGMEQECAAEAFTKALELIFKDMDESPSMMRVTRAAMKCSRCNRVIPPQELPQLLLCVCVPQEPGEVFTLSEVIEKGKKESMDCYHGEKNLKRLTLKKKMPGVMVASYSFTKLPKTLILRLNRDPRKASSKVLLESDKLTVDGVHYRIMSVILHHGREIDQGHYTTLVRRSGSFFHLDDTNVIRVTFSRVSEVFDDPILATKAVLVILESELV